MDARESRVQSHYGLVSIFEASQVYKRPCLVFKFLCLFVFCFVSKKINLFILHMFGCIPATRGLCVEIREQLNRSQFSSSITGVPGLNWHQSSGMSGSTFNQWEVWMAWDPAFIFTSFHICVCISVWVYAAAMHLPMEARRGRQIPLELELQADLRCWKWELRTQPWSFARAGSVLNHWAIPPALPTLGNSHVLYTLCTKANTHAR